MKFIEDFILSRPISIASMLLSVLMAHSYLIEAKYIEDASRQKREIVRAFNWFIFGLSFFFVAICPIAVETKRTLLRLSWILFVFSEIGYRREWLGKVHVVSLVKERIDRAIK